ncbi:MAG: hypothetical protein ABIS35_06760 [Terracoccus sp.]
MSNHERHHRRSNFVGPGEQETEALLREPPEKLDIDVLGCAAAYGERAARPAVVT